MKRAVVTTTALAGAVSAEFIVATLPALPLPSEAGGVLLSQVVIDGFINYAIGAVTTITSLVIRVRRATLTGTLVGIAQTVTAGLAPSTSVAIPIAAADAVIQATPPSIPGQIYVVTMTQAGTGLVAGTVNYAVVTATTS